MSRNLIQQYFMEINQIVGRNLKLLREYNNFTQQQVANFLGIQRSTYANYEIGEREAPVDILEKVCELMGAELYQLFNEDETAVKDALLCSFRAENLCDIDLQEIARFKNIVLNYLKMKRISKK